MAIELPAIGSVWQRRGRLRRVIAADAFRKRRPRDLLPPEDTSAVYVFYSDGGVRNKRCGWPTWRKWAAHAERVTDDSGTFALEVQQ